MTRVRPDLDRAFLLVANVSGGGGFSPRGDSKIFQECSAPTAHLRWPNQGRSQVLEWGGASVFFCWGGGASVFFLGGGEPSLPIPLL